MSDIHCGYCGNDFMAFDVDDVMNHCKNCKDFNDHLARLSAIRDSQALKQVKKE